MDNFEKQPYEEFTISTDFSLNFATDETISTQTVTTTDRLSANVTDTITDQTTIDNDGVGTVSVLVRAGTESKSPYKITFKCVTSAGHKWEKDIKMSVRDI